MIHFELIFAYSTQYGLKLTLYASGYPTAPAASEENTPPFTVRLGLPLRSGALLACLPSATPTPPDYRVFK